MEDNFEREYNVCNALLLNFREPKVFDLSIPSSYNIYSLVKIATRILSGEKVPIKKINCLSTAHDFPQGRLEKKNLSKILSIEVAEDIFGIFRSASKYDVAPLDSHLNLERDVFRSEHFCGKGTWYEFRVGKREETEREVKDFFDSKYLSEVKKIGDAFQPYIGLTSSSAIIS